MLHRLAACAWLLLVLGAGVSADAARPGARPAPGGRPERITVSAAISLSGALEEAADAYAAEGGGEVSFNFAASNVLARQIVNGARVDMFISADGAQMDLVERAGLVAPGTRVPLAGNRLALIAPAGTGHVTSVHSLSDPRVRRIAVGDPAAVPAGVYARQYLQLAGLWRKLQAKLVPTGSVRAALAAVANRATDAGFVYVTDARGAKDVRVVERIEGTHAPAIVYPMCIVTTGAHRDEANPFHAFLLGPQGSAVLQRHGFRPPEP
jgi:molybdate transport system substrate-binding protein